MIKKVFKWYMIWNTIVVYVTYTGICMDYMFRRRGKHVNRILTTTEAHRKSFKCARYGWHKYFDWLTTK